MSSTSKQRFQTYLADGAIAKGKAVKIGSDKEHVAVGAANTDRCIGIAQNTVTTAGDAVEVAMNGAGAVALLAEGVVTGKYLVSSATGALEKANAASDHVCAIAMEDGNVNEIIAVEVVQFNAHAAD